MEFVANALGVYIVICMLVLPFWVYQFIQLMLLSDDDFPGKHDKILWAATFMVAFVAGPLAFRHWKTAYRMMRDEERLKDDGPVEPCQTENREGSDAIE